MGSQSDGDRSTTTEGMGRHCTRTSCSTPLESRMECSCCSLTGCRPSTGQTYLSRRTSAEKTSRSKTKSSTSPTPQQTQGGLGILAATATAQEAGASHDLSNDRKKGPVHSQSKSYTENDPYQKIRTTSNPKTADITSHIPILDTGPIHTASSKTSSRDFATASIPNIF